LALYFTDISQSGQTDTSLKQMKGNSTNAGSVTLLIPYEGFIEGLVKHSML